MKANVLGLSFLVSALCAQPVFATVLQYAMSTKGEPSFAASTFYGYRRTGDGPGDQAFQKCLDLCENGRYTNIKKGYVDVKRPMLLIWGKDSCGTCSKFCEAANDAVSSFPAAIGVFYMINAYFRGDSPACEDAKKFFITHLGLNESNIGCHRMGLYGVFEDGTVMTKVTSLPTSLTLFQSTVNGWKKEWENLYPQHLYTPPRASAGFAAKDETMKVSASTEQVYVPFIRTNNTDAVEKNWLQVEYPDNTTTNIPFKWESNVTDGDVLVPVAGKCDVGQSIQLVLLNTNQVAVATNHIMCVATPANSATCPSGIGAGDLGWGEWTIDYAAATSKVFGANAYLQPDTNELGIVTFETPLDWSTSNRYDTVYTNDITVFASDRVAFEREFSYSVSNVNTVVVTNDLQLFAKLGEFEDLDHVAATEIVVTNTTTTRYVSESDMIDRQTTTNTQAVVASVEATNTVYRVVAGEGGELATNKWSEAAFVVSREVMATNIVQYAFSGGGHESGDVEVKTNLAVVAVNATSTNLYYSGVADATRPFERVFQSGDFVTNCVYAVAPGDGGPVTNDYRGLDGTWLPASAEFRAYATENVTYLLAEAADSEIPAPTSEDSGDVVSETTFRVTDAATYYFVESNDFTSAHFDFSFAASNSVSYVFNGGATTNVDEGAYVVVAAALSASTTNFVSVRLADGSHPAGTVTEYGDFEGRQFSLSYTNAYFSVETNSYQFGISGSSEEPSKAFTLVVHGGMVWDDSLIALNDAVLSSKEFADWCVDNQISLVYLDKAEAGTGASLFSYNLASNGNSGVEFMSMNGLSAEEGEALAAQAEETAKALGLDGDAMSVVALVRADGSVCGYLRPQYNADGTCDLAENMARLGELLAQSADVAEAGNDTVAGAMNFPAVAFGEVSPTNALSVNDTCDVLVATNIPSDTAVTFTVNGVGEAANAQIRVLQLAGSEEISPRVPGIWVFDEEQTGAGLAIEVSAYTDETAVSAKYGGKSRFSYTVTSAEAAENPGKVGFSILADTVKEGEWERVKPGETTGTSTNYQIRVARTEGITGPVTAKISLDMDEAELGAVRGRFKWDEWEDGKSLSWDDLEVGEKAVSVTLLNDGDCYDASNIVFKVEIVNGDAQVSTARFTLTYVEEDPATRGSLEIYELSLAKAGDGKMYVRAGETVGVVVNRSGGSNGNAVGTVVGKIGGKAFETNVYEWAAMSSGFLTNVFTMPLLTAPKTEATFALASTVGKGIDTAKVVVFASDAPEFATNAVTWSGIQYTVTETNLVSLFGVDANMTVKSLYKCHGSVPAGLKVDLVDGKLLVTGTPTTSASSTATFWVVLTRDGGTLYSMPLTVTFESVALADVNPVFNSACSWTGLPLLADVGGSAVATQKLVGLLDLTVAKNGKTSARYRKVGGKTVSLAASGLAGVDTDGTVKLGALKKVKAAGVTTEYVLSATLGADGSLEATVTDGEETVSASAPSGADPWSKDNTAERFGGYYVAAFPLADAENADGNTLCKGAAAMQLKCATASAWKRGAVTFAGTLPNGKTVSGTATFVPVAAGATSATLPIFASSSSDTFASMLDIDGEGVVRTEGVTPYWRHDEGGIEELSYENDYDVVGAAWSRSAWLECFGGTFNAKSAFGVSFNLNMTSGIAAGTMREDISGTGRLSTLQWKGVALPGEPPERPCVLGACWYSVSMPYTDAGGRERKRTVKTGQLVELK